MVELGVGNISRFLGPSLENLPIDYTEGRIKVIPRLCLFAFLQLEE